MRWRRHRVVLACAWLFVAHPPVSFAGQNPSAMPAARPATVIMPPKMVAGEPATLAALDETGRLVPGASIEFAEIGKVVTDATGRAKFTAPYRRGVLVASLPGNVLSASSVILDATEAPTSGVRIEEAPSIASLTEHFEIVGSGFRGEAQANQVWLGENPALILASSPVSLVALATSRASPGLTELRVVTNQRSSAARPITLVGIEVTSDMPGVAQGKRGTLSVRVKGTALRQIVEVRNLSPEVIAMPRGNIQRMATRGNTNNIAVIDLLGLREGDFQVSVKLIPNAEDLPDIEAARLYLISAKQVSPDGFIDRVDRLIRRLERDPSRPERVEAELQEMVKEKSEGELGRRLAAALRTLQKTPVDRP